MDKQKKLQDRQQTLLYTVTVLVTLCLTSGYGEIFCPPAIANSAYTITSENYNFQAEYKDNIIVTLLADSKQLLECNLTTMICTGDVVPTLPELNLSVQVGRPTGFDASQINFTIGMYPESLVATFSVWQRTDRLQVLSNESCLVRVGELIDECTTENPCVNAIRCTDLPLGYFCDCQQGYIGMTCRTGDMRLYYTSLSNESIVFWDWGLCQDIYITCHVSGLEDAIDMDITSTQISSNANTQLAVTVRVSDARVFFNICAEVGISEGLYEIVYELESSRAIESINYTLRVAILSDKNPPKFNKPDNGYAFSVAENAAINSTIISVNKSIVPICPTNECIEVTDPDLGPTDGIDSLFLEVRVPPDAPVRFKENFTHNSFGYFYVAGQLEAGEKYYFLLVVNVSGIEIDTAMVVFTITDINDPPVCNTSTITADVDIRTDPSLIIGSVFCTDEDTTASYKVITYSLEGTYSDYFSIDKQGTIYLQKSLMPLSPVLLNLTAVAIGYSDPPNLSYTSYIPVRISITVPEPECNLTVVRVLETREVNSMAELKLECNNSGVDKLTIVDWSPKDTYSAELTKKSSTVYAIVLTVVKYFPGQIDFMVTVTLGGLSVSESAAMYTLPQFSRFWVNDIADISPIGTTVMSLEVTTDTLGASISWRLTSGDKYEILTPTSGFWNIYLFQAKSVQRYVGEEFSIVCEAQDSVSLLTAEYTWNLTIYDTNQSPVCTFPNPITVNSGMPQGTNISTLNCSDPDITPEYTNLSYRFSTDPPTVNLSISSGGDIILGQPFPLRVTSVRVNVTVSDVSLSISYIVDIIILVVKCPLENSEYGLTFEATPVNSIVTVNCTSLYTGNVSRFCYLNQTWGHFNYTRCRRIDLQSASDLVDQLQANPSNISNQEFADRLENISQQLANSLAKYSTLLSGDIKQMVGIISGVGKLTQKYPNSTLSSRALENFANALDSLLDASEHMWSEALCEQDEEGALLVEALDNIVAASLRPPSSINGDPIVMDNFVIKRESTSGDICYPGCEDGQVQTYHDNSMFLRKDAYKSTQETVSFGVIIYQNGTDKLRINPGLQSDGSLLNKVLNSHIISFTLSVHIPELSPQIELTFTVLERNYSNASCGYLNTKVNETGVWATDGCSATRQGDKVTCRCNHLTNFGILMSPFGEVPPPDNLILSIISAVGCAISIFCLVVTVVVYIYLWKYVKCDRSVLHVNLSVCLILAYTIFLAGVDRTESPIGCKIVAALLHYIYLAVFCIMLGEGIEIFKSVSFVFTSKSILWQLILLSYGVPLVIVAVSLGVTKTEGYGSKTSCWLSTSNGLIWAFVGPVLLILLINFIVLLQVLWIMQRTKQMITKTAQQRTRSVVRTVCILSPILGLTWVFGVLSVNRDTIVFQYLFAIFNSLQGVMIFICYCVIAHQVRDGFQAMRRKYHAKSFDSSQTLSPISSNGKHSDSDTSYNRHMQAFQTANSTSTINTVLSDSVHNGGHNATRSDAHGQSEADGRSRRRYVDHPLLGQTGYTNYGNHDNTVDAAQVYDMPGASTHSRQLPYVQKNLTPAESRAIQNWRRAQEAVSQSASVSVSGESRYQASERGQGYTRAL